MSIRILHLLSQPGTPREQRSIMHIEALAIAGPFHHYSLVNRPLPPDTVLPPAREANDRGFELGAGHYGCYEAHRKAILDHPGDYDALLICECDCIFTVSPARMAERVRRAYQACIDGNLLAFNFGFRHNGKTIDTVGDDVLVVDQWIESHCYLLPKKSLPVFAEMFLQRWDAMDYCLTVYLLDRWKHRVGIFADRPIAVQGDGTSLVDGRHKNSAAHYATIRYKK